MLTLFIQQTKSGLKVGACLVTITITYMFYKSMILELGSEDLIIQYILRCYITQVSADM